MYNLTTVLYESFHRNGALDIRCNYKNGIREGLFEDFDEDGNSRMKLMFKGDKIVDEDSTEDKTSSIAHESGSEAMQTLEKVETFYDENKTIPNEIYHIDKNQRLDGPYESFHRNGAPSVKCTYRNGKLDGPYELFRSGSLSSVKCGYKNGYLDGTYESFHRNGAPDVKCTFRKGRRDGLYELFDADGNLMARLMLKDDKIVDEESTEDKTSSAGE